MLHLVGSSVLLYLIDDARWNKNQAYENDNLLRLVCLSVCLTVRPSVQCNNSVTNGWIFSKYNKAHAFSWWITKATNRQSEHVILINFPRQQWLRERTSVRRYMHIACLVIYKEQNGYWFYVCRFYMNCTALRHTCHSNEFILCTETGIAQSLQLLGYVVCNRGPRFRLCLCKRLFYTMCSPGLGSTDHNWRLISINVAAGWLLSKTDALILYTSFCSQQNFTA